jgi:hypothetical protein
MSAGSVSVSPVVLDGVRFHVTSYSTRYGGRVLVTRDPARGVWCAAHIDASGRVLCRAAMTDSAAQEVAWWNGGDTSRAVARAVCVTL